MNLLRLIDANANRACEGLRVLEDVARLCLNSAAIQSALKIHRHSIRSAIPETVIWQRGSDRDVGSRSKGEKKLEPTQLVSANAKRVQEALRVLEDCLSKQSTTFQKIRFNIYTLEQTLLGRLARPKIHGIYVITHDPKLAQRAIRDGASVIQYRDKLAEPGQKLKRAKIFRQLTRDAGVPLIINDHPDLALLVDADGVHLGQGDYDIASVRNLLPTYMAIGRSTHSLKQGLQAQHQGADYIGVGPVFATPTKPGKTPVGLHYVRQAAQHLEIPWVAIGAINLGNAAAVLRAGARCIAVVRAVDQVKFLRKFYLRVYRSGSA